MANRGRFIIGLALVLVVLVGGGFAVLKFRGHGATASPSSASASITAQPVTITCLGGSEKTELMHDSQVIALLAQRYGLTVNWQSMGSYDQVLLSTDDLKSRGVNCLWPSSASAQHVFEAKHAGAFPDYRADTVLQSPEVIYAGPQGTAALQRAGLVAKTATHYTVDLKSLLLNQVLKTKTWQSLKAGDLQGPINISSTDPAKSNSGFTLAQLELNLVASSDPNRPATVAEATKALKTVRAIYDAQGLQATSSDNGFRQWLTQGGEYQSPLYAGYESQIIQQVTTGSNADAVLKDVRVLYPTPTIYSDHPVIALSKDAARLIDALKDPDIQKIAWTKYGFRSSIDPSISSVATFPKLPLAPTVRTVPAPNSEVTLKLLTCLQDRTKCS